MQHRALPWESTVYEPHLISAMQATKAATARPCTSAGWSLPVASSFSMTDTQPMNTKNMVPSSSAKHGWNSLSNLLGGLSGGFMAPEDTRDAPTSSISIFSSAMILQLGLGAWGEDVSLSMLPQSVRTSMFVPANQADFGVQR